MDVPKQFLCLFKLLPDGLVFSFEKLIFFRVLDIISHQRVMCYVYAYQIQLSN